MWNCRPVDDDNVEEKHFDRLCNEVVKAFAFNNIKIEEAAVFIYDELRHQPWNSNSSYSGIDFDNYYKCCAYLRRFAAYHCTLTRKSTLAVLSHRNSAPVIVRLLKQQALRVVSVGSGPGNDLVGFSSAISMDRRRTFKLLDLTAIDLKEGWRTSFDTLFDLVSKTDYGYVSQLFRAVDVTKSFLHADLTKLTPLCLTLADVVIMTKMISVVSPPQRIVLLWNIFTAMKKGSIFIYTDSFARLVADRATNMGLIVLYLYERDLRNYTATYRTNTGASPSELCVVSKPEDYRECSFP